MYNTTPTYLSKIKEPSRVISAKVDINGTVITEDIIINFSVEDSIGSDKMPTIGGSVASAFKLSIISDASIPSILIDIPIKPSVGVETSTGVFEWIPLGTFYAHSGQVVRNKRTIDIECFDKMPDLDTVQYSSELTFPATIQSMIAEIATDNLIVFKTQTLPTVSFPEAPIGSVRKVLTYIASLTSTNVIVNRDGKFEFKFSNTIPIGTFTFDANNYVDFSLESDSMVRISQLVCVREDNTELVSGNNSGLSIKFDNPAIIDADGLDVVLNRVYPLNFYSYKMILQGMPHLEVGDIVTFTDVDSVVRTIIIAEHKIIYGGGLRSEVNCNAPKSETTQVNVTSGSSVGNSMKNFSKTFEKAIENATSLITGAQGGNVIIVRDENGKPIEILISSTDEIDAPDAHVWRWNREGLGYSSTGYNGAYGLAMTADGQIVADFISAGQLNADIIKTGRLSSLNGNSWIDLDTDQFYFGGVGGFAIGVDGITLDGTSLSEILATKLNSSWEEEFNNYIGFGTGTGLIIGDAVTNNKIQIKGGSITFFDENNTAVATITGNTLLITNAVIKETFIIGNHQFKKYNDDITIVTWIG